jgi:hypothetical protein
MDKSAFRQRMLDAQFLVEEGSITPGMTCTSSF